MQEVSLTLGILLDWPRLLLDFWAWISAIFNVNIAFSGPECLGDSSGGSGYVSRWWFNAIGGPLAIILFHAIVFQIRKAQGKEGVALQAVGSFVLWCKIIYMMVIHLVFETWACSPPVGSPFGTVTLDADPFIECPAIEAGTAFGDYAIVLISGAAVLLCAAGCAPVTNGASLLCACPGTILFLIGVIGMAVAGGGVWGGLFIGGLFLFGIFGIGFVGGSAVAISKGDRDDKEFRVRNAVACSRLLLPLCLSKTHFLPQNSSSLR